MTSRDTSRLITGRCEICDLRITVHVEGVSPCVSDDEWFKGLDPSQRFYLHVRHVEEDSPIVESRTVTRSVRTPVGESMSEYDWIDDE